MVSASGFGGLDACANGLKLKQTTTDDMNFIEWLRVILHYKIVRVTIVGDYIIIRCIFDMRIYVH